MNTENIQKEIARRNKAFKDKTKAQKRVLVAKDIIQLLKLGKIKSEYGYCNNAKIENKAWENPTAGIRELLLQEQTPCDCCAKGAIMVSMTLFNNKESGANWQDNFI